VAPSATPSTPKAQAGKSPAAGASGTPKAMTPAVGTTPGKRKPEAEPTKAAAEVKKARLKDPNELRVYLELEIMRSTKV